MSVLLPKTNVKVSSTAGDLNNHFTSSASQTVTPQFLHMSGPSPSAMVKVFKLSGGDWVQVFAGHLSAGGRGIAIGGQNAPLKFQVVGTGEANFTVTDTATSPTS